MLPDLTLPWVVTGDVGDLRCRAPRVLGRSSCPGRSVDEPLEARRAGEMLQRGTHVPGIVRTSRGRSSSSRGLPESRQVAVTCLYAHRSGLAVETQRAERGGPEFPQAHLPQPTARGRRYWKRRSYRARARFRQCETPLYVRMTFF